MASLQVEITKLVDDHQPGFVECSFVDAEGKKHTFVEKAPVVSTEDLLSTSIYPCRGAVACEVQDRWISSQGEALVRVSTDKPWGIESTERLCTFVVAASLIRTAAE